MSSGESASSSDEEEDARDYKKGGYHPVKIGELFKDAAYEVLTKIGWGHFSTVWLAWDRRADRPVALKIQKSAQRYSEAAVDEIELLKQVAASERAEERNLVLLRDSFVHRGVNGKHHVLAFEVLGDNLLALIKESDYQGLPLAAVRVMASCVLRLLHHLHQRLSIIHTDLKPENVLLTPRPSSSTPSSAARAPTPSRRSGRPPPRRRLPLAYRRRRRQRRRRRRRRRSAYRSSRHVWPAVGGRPRRRRGGRRRLLPSGGSSRAPPTAPPTLREPPAPGGAGG